MSNQDDIIALEKKYFRSMVDKDGDIASKLTARDSIVAGPQGVMAIKDADIGKMMQEGKWELRSFEMSDVHVRFPGDDVAVIGYRIKQDMTMDGRPLTFEAADTSTWVKQDGRWVVAQHSETPIGDAFGGKS